MYIILTISFFSSWRNEPSYTATLLLLMLLCCTMITATTHTYTQPYLQRGDGPIVLVVAPTRELAMQIKQECDKFGASSEIKNTVVYGGVPKHTQTRDLR